MYVSVVLHFTGCRGEEEFLRINALVVHKLTLFPVCNTTVHVEQSGAKFIIALNSTVTQDLKKKKNGTTRMVKAKKHCRCPHSAAMEYVYA